MLVGLAILTAIICWPNSAHADELLGPAVPSWNNWPAPVFGKESYYWPEAKAAREDSATEEDDDDRRDPYPPTDSKGREYVIRIVRVQYEGKWVWRCWQQYLDQPEPDLTKPYKY